MADSVIKVFISSGGARFRVRGRELPQSAAVVVVRPPPRLVLQLPLALGCRWFSAAKTANSLSGGLVPAAAAPSNAGGPDNLVACNDAPQKAFVGVVLSRVIT